MTLIGRGNLSFLKMGKSEQEDKQLFECKELTLFVSIFFPCSQASKVFFPIFVIGLFVMVS